MSLLSKKDVNLLLNAGFDEADLGLTESGRRGVELFESPDSYFARELIQNACEQGECSLYDDIIPSGTPREPYDRSRPGLWDNQEYAGNDDPYEDVKPDLREQVAQIIGGKGNPGIKIGKMTIWQHKDSDDNFKWPVSRLKITVPPEEIERVKDTGRDVQRGLWLAYAKEEWKKCWTAAVNSLWEYHWEGKKEIITKKGKTLNLIILQADNLRKVGYTNLPSEARWVTLVYFIKD